MKEVVIGNIPKSFTQIWTQGIEYFGRTSLTIVIVGASGLGKSTLINNLFGLNIAKASAGKPVTTESTLYRDAFGHVEVIDTLGFTRSNGDEKVLDADLLLDEISKSVEGNLKTNEGRRVKIDLAFYFIMRFQPQDEKVIQDIERLNIPVVIIIAKADANTRTENQQIKDQIKESLDSRGVKRYTVVEMRNPPTPECPVCHEPGVLRGIRKGKAWYCSDPGPDCDEDEYIRKETNDLQISLESLFNAVCGLSEPVKEPKLIVGRCVIPEESEVNVQTIEEKLYHSQKPAVALLEGRNLRKFKIAALIEVKQKTITAAFIEAAATITATIVGATPIPIADAAVLIPIQVVMAISLCRTFGVNPAFDVASVYMIFPFALAGYGIASLLKMIPGVGSVVGAVINASIAGTVTLVLGITIIFMCRQLLFKRMSSMGSEKGTVEREELKFDENFKTSAKMVYEKLCLFQYSFNSRSSVRGVVFEVLHALPSSNPKWEKELLEGVTGVSIEEMQDLESKCDILFSKTTINSEEEKDEAMLALTENLPQLDDEWENVLRETETNEEN